MIINVEKIEPAASSFACNYAVKLIAETRDRLKAEQGLMYRMIPPAAWEALQAEIAARVKQIFMEGAELACSMEICPCPAEKVRCENARIEDALGIPKGV